LLLRKAATAAHDRYGRTALHLAAEHGHSAVLELLLACDALVDARTSSTDRTALHCAADKGQEAAVEVLLSHGADVGALDANGLSPLYLAGAHHHTGVVEQLVGVGDADADLKVRGMLLFRLCGRLLTHVLSSRSQPSMVTRPWSSYFSHTKQESTLRTKTDGPPFTEELAADTRRWLRCCWPAKLTCTPRTVLALRPCPWRRR
jgi:hypothetical protein